MARTVCVSCYHGFRGLWKNLRIIWLCALTLWDTQSLSPTLLYGESFAETEWCPVWNVTVSTSIDGSILLHFPTHRLLRPLPVFTTEPNRELLLPVPLVVATILAWKIRKMVSWLVSHPSLQAICTLDTSRRHYWMITSHMNTPMAMVCWFVVLMTPILQRNLMSSRIRSYMTCHF